MGSQERNDEIHRPVSDSHYGKLLLEDAHANARFVAGINKPRTVPRLVYWLALACFSLRLAKYASAASSYSSRVYPF